MEPSLVAPNRNRSITIDDYLQESNAGTPTRWEGNVERKRGYSSSESDGDENETESGRQAARKKRKPEVVQVGALKRTSASALSLESLQNESDGSDSEQRDEIRKATERRGMHKGRNENRTTRDDEQSKNNRNSAVPTVLEGVNHERRGRGFSKQATPLESVDLDEPEPSRKRVETMSRNESHLHSGVASKREYQQNMSGSICARRGEELESSVDRATCECNASGRCPRTAVANRTNLRSEQGLVAEGNDVENTMRLKSQSPQQKEKQSCSAVEDGGTKRDLVNIPQVSDDDGSGWDRFIFFSFRAQRFDLQTHTYLSTFSPFAAVASDMDGLSSTSVCAVCGAGGVLTECIRCPLAFHKECIDPSRKRLSSPWFCNACKAVKRDDLTESWQPQKPPPPLPSPSTGFDRLLVDVEDGNPIDFVLNPTLFNYYKEECGADWMKCIKCNKIRVSMDGVLTESVHVPFECEYAFWSPNGKMKCSHEQPDGKSAGAAEQVKRYNQQRSRRRNALFFHGFGEENRTDFGYPHLQYMGDGEVIVIDDDGPCVASSAAIRRPDSERREDVPRRAISHVKERSSLKSTDDNVVSSLPRVEVREGESRERAHASSGLAPRLAPRPAPQLSGAGLNERKEVGKPTNAVYQAPTELDGRSTSATDQAEPKNVIQGSSAMQMKESKSTTIRASSSNSPENLASSPHKLNLTPRKGDILSRSDLQSKVGSGIDREMVNELKHTHEASNQLQKHTDHARTENVSDHVKKEEPVMEVHGQWNELKAEDLQQGMLQFIAALDLESDLEDALTDMALASDKKLTGLFLAYRNSKAKFKRHATRVARRLITDGHSAGQNLVPGGDSGTSTAR